MNDLIARWWYKGKQNRWQSFVYLSETPDPEMADRNEAEDLSSISLAETKVGDRIRIVALNCGEANNRLMGMGLMPGVQLQVVSVTGTGSAIVALDDNRLGLEAKMAQQIQVQKADMPTSPKANLKNNQVLAANKSTENHHFKLRDASIGSILKVISYAPGSRDYKRKLLAMGLTPGTEFTVKRHAPLGDPTEIEVRGFRLSLRKGEADALVVEPARNF
jgi:ferrous iron transport protein A